MFNDHNNLDFWISPVFTLLITCNCVPYSDVRACRQQHQNIEQSIESERERYELCRREYDNGISGCFTSLDTVTSERKECGSLLPIENENYFACLEKLTRCNQEFENKCTPYRETSMQECEAAVQLRSEEVRVRTEEKVSIILNGNCLPEQEARKIQQEFEQLAYECEHVPHP